MCHPKGLELLWETKPPFFKKYWAIWDGTEAATPSNELTFANINDNPDDWQPFSWEEAEGRRTAASCSSSSRPGRRGP
jgi:hypothetical protein